MAQKTKEELKLRSAARKFVRNVHESHKAGNVTILNNDDDITSDFWTAMPLVWESLEVKDRETVSQSEQVYDYVADREEPTSDMQLYMEFRISTVDVRRYLVKQCENDCVIIEKPDGKDTLFAISCDENHVEFGKDDVDDDGWKRSFLRERSPNKNKGEQG